MGSRFIAISLALCLAAIGFVSFFTEGTKVWTCALSAFSLLLLTLLFRSVILPRETTVRGMELIKAQDFNNRLSKVGERDADKIVDLFNTIIDRLRNERLKNKEQDGFLRLLVEASPMGVAMLDFDGRVSMANRSFVEILGLHASEDLTGQSLASFSSELVSRMMEVPLGESRVIRGGDIRSYRCSHLSFMSSGFARRFYLLESLTEELMKAERSAYEKVIRVMSHEVNNTMGGVRSVLQVLRDVCGDREIEEVIDSCDDRCGKMCGFISSYADVVRVPAPVLIKVDLNGKLSDLMPFLRGMLREDISLDFHPAQESLYVPFDQVLMQQVIVNIVKNAAESIEGEGVIHITTADMGRKVLLEVANDGSPIGEDVSRQLFSPFFTTKKEGRGIGLTLISEILNRHEAAYSLRTGSDGLTRFRIELNKD